MEEGAAEVEDDVVVQERSVLQAQAIVPTDVLPDIRLVQENLQRLGVYEPQVIDVQDRTQLLEDLEIGAEIEEKKAGVDEIRLTLDLAAAQARDEAVLLDEVDTVQADGLVVEETVLAAGEFLQVKDGIKTLRLVVARVRIPGGIKSGSPETHPVAVVRELEGGELAFNIRFLTGLRIQPIFAECEIEGVVHIDATDVAVACPAEIDGVELVVRRGPGRIRAHEETVSVVTGRAPVMVIMDAELVRPAEAAQKILEISIRHQDLLVATLQPVELAVGVFFEHVEAGEVPLNLIVVPVPKKATAEVGIAEDQTAEIRRERLDASPNGNEIVIRADVGDVDLAQGLLQGEIEPGAVRAGGGADVDDAAFVSPKIIDVQDRSDP